jgi:FKBP-type peptidyl-prolyl cis-trans isomerase 2
MLQDMQINKYNIAYKQNKGQNLIISIEAEEAFGKIQHSFVNSLEKLGMEGISLDIIKAI